jgi:hypothetical protein
MNMKSIACWVATTLIALETFVGGITDLVHGGTSQHHDDEARCANKLKYCRYSLVRNEHGNRIDEQQEDGHGRNQRPH